MTLRTLFSLRIFFRIARLVTVLFAALDGAVVAGGIYHREFGRDLLIYATWTALCVIVAILLTEAMRIVSEK